MTEDEKSQLFIKRIEFWAGIVTGEILNGNDFEDRGEAGKDNAAQVADKALDAFDARFEEIKSEEWREARDRVNRYYNDSESVSAIPEITKEITIETEGKDRIWISRKRRGS